MSVQAFCSFFIWVVCFHTEFWEFPISPMLGYVNIFSQSIARFFILLTVSFTEHYDEVHLLSFNGSYFLVACLRTLITGHKNVPFFSYNFYTLKFCIWIFDYFRVNFPIHVRSKSKFFPFSIRISNCFSSMWWKHYILPWTGMAPLLKINWPICVGQFLDMLFCFQQFICLSPYHHHTVLIAATW